MATISVLYALWTTTEGTSRSGADPGFPKAGGANPPGDGRQHTNLPDFPKNCMKLRKFWSVWGGAPLDPPL